VLNISSASLFPLHQFPIIIHSFLKHCFSTNPWKATTITSTLHHLDYAGTCAALNGNTSYAPLIASSFSAPSIGNSTAPTVAHNTTLPANKTITKLSNNTQSMQVVPREDDPWVLVDRTLEPKQSKQPGSRETHTKEPS
jgi:hypothetical protein